MWSAPTSTTTDRSELSPWACGNQRSSAWHRKGPYRTTRLSADSPQDGSMGINESHRQTCRSVLERRRQSTAVTCAGRVQARLRVVVAHYSSDRMEANSVRGPAQGAADSGQYSYFWISWPVEMRGGTPAWRWLEPCGCRRRQPCGSADHSRPWHQSRHG